MARDGLHLKPGQYAILDLRSPSGNKIFAVDWHSVVYSQTSVPVQRLDEGRQVTWRT